MAGVFNRKAARDRLNRQKNRLKSKGASPAEIGDYFGVPFGVPFGTLSNDDLKTIIDRVDKTPRVTVKDGYIFPERYIKARKIWDSEGIKQPLVKGYKRALETGFIKQDKTLSDTLKRAKQRQRQYIDAYAKGLRNLGLNDIANRVEKTSYKNIRRFVLSGQGLLDLNTIWGGSPKIGEDDIVDYNDLNDQINERNSTLKDQITALWSQYDKRKLPKGR